MMSKSGLDGERSQIAFFSGAFLPRLWKISSRHAQQAQGVQGGLDDVGVVAGAEGLGEDILHADGFADGADAAAGDDAGSGRGGLEQDVAAA